MQLTVGQLRHAIREVVRPLLGEKKRRKALVKPGRGGFRVDKPEHVRGYWRRNADGSRSYVDAHEQESDTLAMDYTPEPKDEGGIDEKKKRKKKKKGKSKEYHASAGSVSVVRKKGCEKAIKDGDFDWAGNGKWAACQSAHIVATGKPTVPKGADFVGGKGPHGGGKGSHMVKPRKGKRKKK